MRRRAARRSCIRASGMQQQLAAAGAGAVADDHPVYHQGESRARGLVKRRGEGTGGVCGRGDFGRALVHASEHWLALVRASMCGCAPAGARQHARARSRMRRRGKARACRDTRVGGVSEAEVGGVVVRTLTRCAARSDAGARNRSA